MAQKSITKKSNKGPSHVTIDDVAKYAGVSTATVSRVINDNYPVSDELRQQVQSAIAALGYQPDRAARRLRANSSEILGIIIPDIQNPYFTSVVRGIEDMAYTHQMNVLLCNTDDDPLKQENYLRVLRAERAAGVVLAASFGIRAEAIQELQNAGIPIVLIDRLVPNLEIDAVLVDNVQGSYMATLHLVDLGHQRIGLIVGDQELTPGFQRYQGYQQALRDSGIRLEPEYIRIGHFKIESGYRLAKDLLQLPVPPDAIFAASNLISLGVLKAVREMNLRIPEDVAVVGFDDMVWANELYAPLTTVAQPMYEVGQEAARLLFQRQSDPAIPVRTIMLRASLIVRESCGAHILKGGDSSIPT
jgi:DNA-binding LacI/PurR family transcriptional regulator